MVKPVHPEVYQWFFKLPGGQREGKITSKYGFLTYLDVSNKGLRDVALDDWCLYLETLGDKRVELKPISITEPKIHLGQSGIPKTYRVLGVKGEISTGETMVRSGDSISGFAYYIFEYWGWDGWSLVGKDGTVTGSVVVSDIFGKRTSARFVFKEISLDKAQSMVPDIDKIDVS
jgi:hypothetical protein